jgi:hypothetical protein
MGRPEQHFFGVVLKHASAACFQVRAGAILLQELSARLIGAERHKGFGDSTSIGQVLGDDKGLRKALALDFAESATATWSNVAIAELTHALLIHPVECITVSDLTPDLREIVHDALVHPGYLGACEIDRGNPVMLKLAAGLLIPYYQYSYGSLEVLKTFEGDDDMVPHWAKGMPFTAVKIAEIAVSAIPSDTLSARGKKSIRLLESRQPWHRNHHVPHPGRRSPGNYGI